MMRILLHSVFIYILHIYLFCNLGCRMHFLIAKETESTLHLCIQAKKVECIYFLLSGYVLLGEQRHLKIHGDLKS